jgi:hypothetical protein
MTCQSSLPPTTQEAYLAAASLLELNTATGSGKKKNENDLSLQEARSAPDHSHSGSSNTTSTSLFNPMVIPREAMASRRTPRPPSPYRGGNQLGGENEFQLTTTLVTPGALCSTSTLFFQPQSHAASGSGISNDLTIPSIGSFGTGSHSGGGGGGGNAALAYSYGPPGIIGAAGHFQPPPSVPIPIARIHHRASNNAPPPLAAFSSSSSDRTTQEMERLGMESSIIRSPSNLARGLELLEERAKGQSAAAGTSSNAVVADPFGTDEISGVPDCELSLIIQLSQLVFGSDIAQKVQQHSLQYPIQLPSTSGANGINTLAPVPPVTSFLTHLSHVVATPRRVCQHPFKRNDIVWVCRTCQSDETCVLCHACWTRSNHEGHDVAFYHAQAGGCCDCGDPDAWDPNGFCDVHGMRGSASGAAGSEKEDKQDPEQRRLTQKCRGVVGAIMDWLTEVVVADAEGSFYPAPTGGPSSQTTTNHTSSTATASSSSGVDGGARNHNYDHDLDLHPQHGDLTNVDAEVIEDLNMEMICPTKANTKMALQDAISVDTTFHSVLSSATSTSTFGEPLLSLGLSPSQSKSQSQPQLYQLLDSQQQAPTSSSGHQDQHIADEDKDAIDVDMAMDDSAPNQYGSPTRDGHGIGAELMLQQPLTPPASTYASGETTPKAAQQQFKTLHGHNHHAPLDSSILASQAGTPKTRILSKQTHSQYESTAHELAHKGRTQGGFYLVLHCMDIPWNAHHHHHPGAEASWMHHNRNGDQSTAVLGDVLGPAGPAHSLSLYQQSMLVCKQYGELALLGTSDVVTGVGMETSKCWRDGDRLKTTLVGKWMLEQVTKLQSNGGHWNCSVKTHLQLLREQRATAIISWLSVLARSSDILCQTIAEAIEGNRHLIPLLKGDLKLPHHLTKKWHALLLTLLAVPRFKMELAQAYCDTYALVTNEYARGIGVSDASSFTLSVQFLNRQTYVRELAAHRQLLNRLTNALYFTLRAAQVRRLRKMLTAGVTSSGNSSSSSNSNTNPRVPSYDRVLDPAAPVMAQRRYSPCISDIKCVLNVQGMPRLFATKCLGTWIAILTLSQGMDKQQWRSWSDGHVESEPRGWVGAFNCSISLGSLFERVLTWEEDTDADDNTKSAGQPLALALGGKSDQSLPVTAKAHPQLRSCKSVAHIVFDGIAQWQRTEVTHYQSRNGSIGSRKKDNGNDDDLPEDDDGQGGGGGGGGGMNTNTGAGRNSNNAPLQAHERCPAALPYSTIHTRRGTALAQPALPMSQVEPWSFHYPLHRFLAVNLREVARREDLHQRLGLEAWMEERTTSSPSRSASSSMQLQLQRSDEFKWHRLMEFPLSVLSRAAQVRADMWKRNGSIMVDQVLNYAEPPFCRSLRDADLSLLQFATVALNYTVERAGAGAGLGASPPQPPCSTLTLGGTCYLTNLLLHRYGIFDFCGFGKGPNREVSRYAAEVKAGLYPAELPRASALRQQQQSSSSAPSPSFRSSSTGSPSRVLNRQQAMMDDSDSSRRLLDVTESGSSTVELEVEPPTTTATTMTMTSAARGENERAAMASSAATAGGASASVSPSIFTLPSTAYFPPVDPKSSLSLLEEVLHTLIVLVTELPSPPSGDRAVQIEQAKQRLRREVVHRLVSGAKTHSELSEVHHVLSQRDNTALSEEGRKFNPNDASGALLEITLRQVASRRPTRGLDPDQWVLQKDIWEEYDPAFFHIASKSHEAAAEIRPKATSAKSPVAHFAPRPYAPRPLPAHRVMARLRRDLTADAVVVTLIYRTLHTHLSDISVEEDQVPSRYPSNLRGKTMYEKGALNETLLARAVHLLTLGAFCWEESSPKSVETWILNGGGGVGSVLYQHPAQPGAKEWISAVLLEKPSKLMENDWYRDEDCMLILLQRLASTGDGRGKFFTSQDASLRSGAAWLCDYAILYNKEEASRVFQVEDAAKLSQEGGSTFEANSSSKKGGETDMKRRQREAKERAMTRFAQMQQAAQKKFLDPEVAAGGDDSVQDNDSTSATSTSRPSSFKLGGSFLFDKPTDDGYDSGLKQTSGGDVTDDNATATSGGGEGSSVDMGISLGGSHRRRRHCLLQERPTCIHCHDDSTTSAADLTPDMEGAGGSGVHKSDALAFCGLAQSSTVLKGGGGPFKGIQANLFVGVHVQLCGHAIHTSCCDAYLASSSTRDSSADATSSSSDKKRGEFRCPMCQRLSNCLVPFIDVEASWIDDDTDEAQDAMNNRRKDTGSSMFDMSDDGDEESLGAASSSSSITQVRPSTKLHDFLSPDDPTNWILDNAGWDGWCNFEVRIVDDFALPSSPSANAPSDVAAAATTMTASTPGRPNMSLRRPSSRLRRSFRSFGKKDLFAAWSLVMRSPRRRKPSSSSFTHGRRSISSGGSNNVDPSSPHPLSSTVGSEAPHIGNEAAAANSSSKRNMTGDTDVWRRLMDQVTEVACKADYKRLGGDKGLVSSAPSNGVGAGFGEFRHYLTEELIYNFKNMEHSKFVKRQEVRLPIVVTFAILVLLLSSHMHALPCTSPLTSTFPVAHLCRRLGRR